MDPRCCAPPLSAVLLGALLWLRPSEDFSYSTSHMDFYYAALCRVACPAHPAATRGRGRDIRSLRMMRMMMLS